MLGFGGVNILFEVCLKKKNGDKKFANMTRFPEFRLSQECVEMLFLGHFPYFFFPSYTTPTIACSLLSWLPATFPELRFQVECSTPFRSFSTFVYTYSKSSMKLKNIPKNEG